MLCRSALSAQSRISATKKSRTGCRSGNRRGLPPLSSCAAPVQELGAALAFLLLAAKEDLRAFPSTTLLCSKRSGHRFRRRSQGSPISRTKTSPMPFEQGLDRLSLSKIVDLMARTVKVLANAFDGRGSSSISTDEFHTTAEVAKTTAVAAARRGMRRPLAVHLRDCASASPEIRISSSTFSAYPAGLPTNDKATSVRNSTATRGLRFWLSEGACVEAAYGKCFSASLSASLTSSRDAFVFEKVTSTWNNPPAGL